MALRGRVQEEHRCRSFQNPSLGSPPIRGHPALAPGATRPWPPVSPVAFDGKCRVPVPSPSRHGSGR